MNRARTPRLLPFLVALAGCGGPTPVVVQPDLGPPTRPFTAPPASTVLEPGVRLDLVRVPGAAAPENPVTHDKTPADYQAVQVLRYRSDVTPPTPARAIVLAMPGLLGGGGSFDPLARTLVKQSAVAGSPIEVWAIDRRANLLEDVRGFEAAAAASDPEVAEDYYFGNLVLGGKPFAGFKQQADVPFESEWGLALLVADLMNVIALVPADLRLGHLFLLGHSLGGSFTEAFAGWRFDDGTSGYQQLAGLILVDGLLGSAPASQTDYHMGTAASFGPQPGVDGIRAMTRYLAIPVLGVEVYAHAEVMSARALAHPTAITADDDRDTMLGFLLGLPSGVPKMTDAAALGLSFDDSSCPLAFARASLGEPSGGKVELRKNPFGTDMIERPADPTATYGWTDALDATPAEWTPLADLAHAFFAGGTNFAEWYFPLRLTVDLSAVGGGNLDEKSWQAGEGLRVFDNAKIDAPLLAISAGLTTAASFDAVKGRLSGTVGPGRPLAGKTRDDASAFRVLRVEMTHLDPLLAAARPENPVPGAILDFVRASTAAGNVTLPQM